MDASTLAPGRPPSRPRSQGTAIRLAIAVGCAVVLVLAISAYLVVFSLEPSAIEKRLVEVLSQGEQKLDVPIMTLYTAPPIPGASVDSEVSWNSSSANPSPSTTYRLHWNLTSKEDEPVRFVFNPKLLEGAAGTFQGGENDVLFYPAGICRGECTRTGHGLRASGPNGVRQVVYEVWQLRYAVQRVTEVAGTHMISFLEVDFAFGRIQIVGDTLPAANVTDPGPEDRAGLSIHRLGAGSWVKMSVQGQTSVPNLFRNRLSTVTFDAGRLGTVDARLDSQYSWSPADDYSLSFSASSDATIQYSIDLRFGSLFIDYVEWPYP